MGYAPILPTGSPSARDHIWSLLECDRAQDLRTRYESRPEPVRWWHAQRHDRNGIVSIMLLFPLEMW